MASAATSSSERLLSCRWAPVDIGDSRFLCKSWFGRTQYHVLLMDSGGLWEEQLEAAEIQSRAEELNRRLRASVDSLFSHLVAAVTPCLTGSGSDHVTLRRRDDGHMTLRLKSELAGLPFYWEFQLRPAPAATACVQLVRPLLVMSGALQRQTELLSQLLRRKDAEIQDYRENGAQLTRERLRTEPFDEETFRGDFVTKSLPRLLEEDSLDLDPDLQELYSSIVQRQTAINKRKRRDSEPDAGRHEDEDENEDESEDKQRGEAPGQKEAEPTENAKPQPPEAKKTTLPTMQQTAASFPSDRAAPKPKKKKTGLFR